MDLESLRLFFLLVIAIVWLVSNLKSENVLFDLMTGVATGNAFLYLGFLFNIYSRKGETIFYSNPEKLYLCSLACGFISVVFFVKTAYVLVLTKKLLVKEKESEYPIK